MNPTITGRLHRQPTFSNPEGYDVDVDRSDVIALLRGHGSDDDALRAAAALPAQIDTQNHADQQLLQRYGIDVGDLLTYLGAFGG